MVGCLLLGSFAGCAEVLGIESWQDPPGTSPGEGASNAVSTASGDGDSAEQTGPSAQSTGSEGSALPCMNGRQDGQETDVDCGGPITDICPRCEEGKKCVASSDCITNSCESSGRCGPPVPPMCMPSNGGETCNDCMKGTAETDVDCGGELCLPCSAGKLCQIDGDCISLACAPAEGDLRRCLASKSGLPCRTEDDCLSPLTCQADNDIKCVATKKCCH